VPLGTQIVTRVDRQTSKGNLPQMAGVDMELHEKEFARLLTELEQAGRDSSVPELPASQRCAKRPAYPRPTSAWNLEQYLTVTSCSRCLTLSRVTAYSFVEGFFAPSADRIGAARVLHPELHRSA
jgi:hypothetical protein